MKKQRTHVHPLHSHTAGDHAVLIFLQFSEGKLKQESAVSAVFDLQDILREVIEEANVGIFDRNEFYEDSVTFFMYGPDANIIHETISPILNQLPLFPGSYIIKRFGDIGAVEERIFLE